MPQKKSKKILLYFFLFLLIGTINNKNLNNLELTKIENVTVSGLDDKNNYELINNLDFLKIESLFFLDKKKIIQTINLIEKYSVFKKYPSEIEIKVDQTNFLAQLKKGNENFLFGSNGKLIKTISFKSNIPFIFGNFDKENFFKLKRAIDETNFRYEEVKNLFFFPSGRWDIETNSGLLIKLPRDNFKKSLELLVSFLNSTKKNEINKIDLRQTNQIITNG
jgi:cell division protein FtsQ